MERDLRRGAQSTEGTPHVRHIKPLASASYADQHTQCGIALAVFLDQQFTLCCGGFAGEHRCHHTRVQKLSGHFLAVLDGGAEHDGLSVLAELHHLPSPLHVDDFHAAFFGGAIRPLAARRCSAAHVGTLAGEHPHWHQHARLREVMHGGGVDQVREQLSQAG